MMLNESQRFDTLLRSKGFEPIFAETNQYLTKEQCLAYAGKIDGWLAGDDVIDEEVIVEMLPRLRVISKWGTGLDSVDLEAAARLNLKIFNTPGAFDEAVGEMAVAYTLALTRSIVSTHSKVAAGEWPKPRHRSLSELKVGILGAGAIGIGIMKRLTPFGCNLQFFDPLVEFNDLAEKVSSDELARSSDVVILCCNLTKDNRHFINSVFLHKMKPTSYIVNVGRGALIDEKALVDALSSGIIAGAALDVFEVEPLEDGARFDGLNVILGSHNSNNTNKAVEFVHSNTILNLVDAFNQNSMRDFEL